MAFIDEEMRWQNTIDSQGETINVRIPNNVGFWIRDDYSQLVFVAEVYEETAIDIVNNLAREAIIPKLGRLG